LLSLYSVRVLNIMVVAALMALAPAAAWAQDPTVVLQGRDGRGQPFDLAALRGQVVAVTFVSRYTQDEAHRVHEALSKHGEVKVVVVVDFTGIPSFAHGFARRKLAQADGRIQHLCDENGALGRQFGAVPGKRVDIVIVDRDGQMRGHYAGLPQLGQAERRLDEVRSTTAAR
jgi:hypothetical protein